MVYDIKNIVGNGVSENGIYNALEKFEYDFDATVDYLTKRKEDKKHKKNETPEVVQKKPKKDKKHKKEKLQVKRKNSRAKELEEELANSLIIERKRSRKLSKEEIIDKPFERKNWNSLYPIIDYSL